MAFVDFEKAFGHVDRYLLFKFMLLGIGGKILNVITNVYSDCKSCINIKGFLTRFFKIILTSLFSTCRLYSQKTMFVYMYLSNNMCNLLFKKAQK